MPQLFSRNVLHPPKGNTAAGDSPTGAAATTPYPTKALWGTLMQVVRRSQHAPQVPGQPARIGEPPAAGDVARFIKTHAEGMKEIAASPPGPKSTPAPAPQPPKGAQTRK